MRPVWLFAACLWFSASVTHAQSFDYEERSAPKAVGQFQPDAANTPGRDQFGDGPPVTRNGQMHLQFTAKDNNGFGNSLNFDYLRLNRRIGASRILIASDEADKNITANWTWWSRNTTTSQFGLAVGDSILFEWELQFRDFTGAIRRNFYYIRTVVGQPLPSLPDWRRVDYHVHGYQSDDQIHSGMHYGHMGKVGRSVGLDAIGVSDHSPNVLPIEWQLIKNDCANNSDTGFVMFPGIELTLDNDEQNQTPDGRLHFLALGLTRLLPAPEECCTDNASGQLWTLRQALDSVAVQNAVAFAAHPTDGLVFPNEGTLGMWSQSNYDLALSYPPGVFAGLEFFNERRTTFNLGDNTYVRDEFVYPYAWQPNPNWESRWLNGMNVYLQQVQQHLNPVRPIAIGASSDAHMAAYETYFEAPDDLGAYRNGLGSVHSLVYAPGSLSQTGILNGMRQAAIVMTDGPAFTFWVDTNGDGVSEGTIGGQFPLGANASFRLQGLSIPEFGDFTDLRIIRVTPTSIDTTTSFIGTQLINQTRAANSFAHPTAWVAVLMDVRTSNGYRAVTSPVYLAPQSLVGVDPSTPEELFLTKPRPNPMTTLTRWSVTLALPSPARVEIMDVGGRTVRRLHDGLLEAGTHPFTWDGRDDAGRQCSTGVYFISVRSGSWGQSRKTLYLR